MGKSSSHNYDPNRMHQYVIDGIKLFGTDGWITSIIERERDKRKDGKLVQSGRITKCEITDSKL